MNENFHIFALSEYYDTLGNVMNNPYVIVHLDLKGTIYRATLKVLLTEGDSYEEALSKCLRDISTDLHLKHLVDQNHKTPRSDEDETTSI